MSTEEENSPGMLAAEDKKQPTQADTASFKEGDVEAVIAAADIEDLKISGLDPTFEAKADLVNHSLQAIGMGKYQWWLFVVTGFGWLVDQVSHSASARPKSDSGRGMLTGNLCYPGHGDRDESYFAPSRGRIQPEVPSLSDAGPVCSRC
jgi:hypothetical protein